jgi:Protein of unknown function (DUF3224)
MKLWYAARMWTLAGLGLCAGLAADHGVRAQAARTTQKEAAVAHHASGTFDVKLTPQQPEEALADSGIGRMLLDKQFHGDLEAASKGEMLAFGGRAKGSGGYVAIERVTGALGGRSGSFALQHSGTMRPGALQLSITVIPDSGTGELAGIAGSMNILIEGGKHSYTFDYTLPEGP